VSNLEKFNLDSIEQTFTSFKNGQMINATVIAKTREGFVVNIGGKKDGFIPYSELEDKVLVNVKVGDNFNTVIISTRDESGMVIVSKAKADAIITGNAIIGGLKVGDVTNFIITNFNKSGLISSIGSFDVFIPYSQISARRVDNDLKNYVNKQLTAAIIELDLANNKIVASVKAHEQEEQQTKEVAFWNAIFENKVVTGRVVRFTDFGVFVNVDGVDCLVHNSEASYSRDKKASEVFEMDKEYDFRVIKIDRDSKKISLSRKALIENPQIAKLKALKVGDIVEGKVVKILPFGAVITFGDDVEGLLHVKEASHFYVKNVYEVAKVNQMLTLKIIDIDTENLKVSLSLKALQEEPEVTKLKKETESNSGETVTD
jgi:4-hydroxy-3-methylbut-2-enyl diphosphate reductase